MKLHEIAHGRSGDKGDISNISIITYDADCFEQLCAMITIERVSAQLDQPAKNIRRYVLPQLHAMNFVINEALQGGVTRALAQDAHGKCLSSILLDITLPDAIQ
jgi:hypothetical protein